MTTPIQGRLACPRCGQPMVARDPEDGGGYDHDLVPSPDSPCYTPPAVATDRERLREFALAVEQALAADDLTSEQRLARITVAHTRLTGVAASLEADR